MIRLFSEERGGKRERGGRERKYIEAMLWRDRAGGKKKKDPVEGKGREGRRGLSGGPTPRR